MKIEWNNITKIKTSNRLYKKRIAELEAIIRGRDEFINNAVSSRIAELEKENKLLKQVETLKEQE